MLAFCLISSYLFLSRNHFFLGSATGGRICVAHLFLENLFFEVQVTSAQDGIKKNYIFFMLVKLFSLFVAFYIVSRG